MTAPNSFGSFIRERREELRSSDGQAYSLRKVAARIGIGPTYLSKIENGLDQPPSEERILLLADELRIDRNVLLAMAGKVSRDLQQIILSRPQLFAELLAACKDLPDNAVLRVVREVRTGEW